MFLFADNQIKDESFMEDISMILNTGDVPNLYAADEKADIIEKMQGVARNEVFYFTITLPKIRHFTSSVFRLTKQHTPCKVFVKREKKHVLRVSFRTPLLK